MVKISPIIACYRDAPALRIMHQRLTAVLQKIGLDYEIIFVNDCSPDNAKDILAELAREDPKVIVVNHSRNFGSQSAFTSGMRISTGHAVVLLDGDLQDPPELIEEFYAKWLEGFEVVYGVRIRRETGVLMGMAYKAFYRLFKLVSYVPIPVDAGDFSLLDRRVVQVLNLLPEKNRFIRGLRAWAGFKQTGVPYERPERMFGSSTNSLLKNMEWARLAIFSFSFKPLDMITVLALCTVLVSLLATVWQLCLRLFKPEWVPSGFTTLIILILFMGGVQLLCLSIIGAYLAQIYEEVKSRPSYIVDSVLNPPSLPGPQQSDE